MSSSGGTQRHAARPRVDVARLRARAPRWSGAAWAAIGITVLFVVLSCWWVTQDRSTPYGDAAQHLSEAFALRDRLADAQVGAAIENGQSFYPPYTKIVIALAVLIGGINLPAPVIGENLVYVTLLALGCYHTGRLTFGRNAGLLAVIYALGAPLVIEQFHVIMLDAPVAALVAAAVWLILLSERFNRVGIAALAGLVVGLGTGTKEQFPLYLVGFLLVFLRRGGWQNLRGMTAFVAVAVAVGSPWYLIHLDDWSFLLNAANAGDNLPWPVPASARPSLLSLSNFGWYGWATLNGLLFAPLALFALAGVAQATLTLVRERRTASREARPRPAARRTAGGRARTAFVPPPRERETFVPELLGGLVGSWLLLTLMQHKDMRYTMGMIVYIAVLGTGWIPRLRVVPRVAATTALALAVVATTLGATFGVGGLTSERLPGNWTAPQGEGVPPIKRVVVYASNNYLVSGPRRDTDLLALMRTLRRRGVTEIVWDLDQAPPSSSSYNALGLEVLARIAKLRQPELPDVRLLRKGEAALIRQRTLKGVPPCIRLQEGMGVWVRVGPGANSDPICPSPP